MSTSSAPAGDPADTTIGFVGLGHMGGPMAINLAKAGYAVHGFDLVPEAVAKAEAGGVVAVDSVAAAAEGADVVLTSLPNGALVLGVYRGEDGILANAEPGALLIDTSTIDVDDARTAADEARAATPRRGRSRSWSAARRTRSPRHARCSTCSAPAPCAAATPAPARP
jgi:3-hydroxyisobutyrate dehydrogenase